MQSAADAEACPSLLNRFSATRESLKTSSEKNSHFPQELEARGRRLRKPRAGPLRARQPPGGPLGPRRRAQPRAEAPGSPGRSGKRPFPPPSKRPNRHLCTPGVRCSGGPKAEKIARFKALTRNFQPVPPCGRGSTRRHRPRPPKMGSKWEIVLQWSLLIND